MRRRGNAAGRAGGVPLVLALVLTLALSACATPPRSGPDGPGTGPEDSLWRAALDVEAGGQPLEAERLLRGALARDPENAALWRDLARLLRERGALDDALNALAGALEASPNDVDALVGQGQIWLLKGEPGEATRPFSAAYRADPSDIRAAVGLGLALDGLGRHAEAHGFYRAALEQDPSNVAARNNLGLSLVLSGDLDRGLSILTALEAATADDPVANGTVRANLARANGLADAARLAQARAEVARLEALRSSRARPTKAEAAGGDVLPPPPTDPGSAPSDLRPEL